ncbi:periplasmic binding protein-like II, partial [Anaeromyces robustus]
MKNILRFIFIILSLYLYIVNGINIEAIVFAHEDMSEIYGFFENEFNNYSLNNNLNITLSINMLSTTNSSFSFINYGSTTDSLLKKKSNKYDIFIYDNLYISEYEPYLIDLTEYFEQDDINKFDQNILNKMCRHNNRLVGFPARINYSVLYSNKYLLSKYNKNIPKTWDELISTSKEILNEEKKLNNTDLISYNGLFNDSEGGFCSIYEFIYSFRSSVNSSFPEITSEETSNALEILKTLKSEISSDSIFLSNDAYTIDKLMSYRSLFIKFWMFHRPQIYRLQPFYNISALPGHIEGVNGSTICGYNLGIKKGIDKEKIEATIKAIKFFISDEFQKTVVKEKIMLSVIPRVYEDKKVCESVDCELFKSIQFIVRPVDKINDLNISIDEYIEKFRNYAYEFLYENQTLSDTIDKINDLTKIYYVSLDSKVTNAGIIIIIIILILMAIMATSLIFLFHKKLKPFFSFLPDSFWIISIMGCI